MLKENRPTQRRASSQCKCRTHQKLDKARIRFLVEKSSPLEHALQWSRPGLIATLAEPHGVVTFRLRSVGIGNKERIGSLYRLIGNKERLFID